MYRNLPHPPRFATFNPQPHLPQLYPLAEYQPSIPTETTDNSAKPLLGGNNGSNITSPSASANVTETNLLLPTTPYLTHASTNNVRIFLVSKMYFSSDRNRVLKVILLYLNENSLHHRQ